MQTIRIFISSPGDVDDERAKAKQVIAALQRRYDDQVELIPVLWEDLAIPATASFQEGIEFVLAEGRRVDIAVFILWSRLGSPLGAGITKPDGSAYRSGTEREFDLMLSAFEQSGRKMPIILAYTRDDSDGFNDRLDARTQGEDALEELLRQRKLVKQFISENFHDEKGRNLRAYHTYREPVSFAQRLHVHLRLAVDELTGLDQPSITWTEAPYRSLEVFDIRHAPIFCGRDEETCDLLQRLRDQERAGCAFTCIVGASGSGKSSLARAGVAATLLQRSFDDGVKEWRAAVFLPSLAAGDLFLALARTLAEPLPELRAGVGGLDRFAKMLGDQNHEAASILMETAFKTARDKLGGPLRLLLVLDQMEELWTDRSITPEQREKFLQAIEALACGGGLSVLATLRSDFYPQAQLSEAFLRIKGERGHFDLTPPGTGALQKLIVQPAHRAGLRFEREERTGRTLDQRILEDAARDPSALPLLQYAMTELYERRDEKRHLLTFAAYEALGRVEGALGKRACQVFEKLPAEVRATLDELLPLLISLDLAGERNPVRRRAPLSELTSTPARRRLTEALVERRFLTTDDQSGTPIVTLAHEALLRRWERIREWINTNRNLLRMRARVEQYHAMWEESGRNESRLLPDGLPLEEARQLLGDPAHILDAGTYHFINESAAHHAAIAEKELNRQREIAERERALAEAARHAAKEAEVARGLEAQQRMLAERRGTELEKALVEQSELLLSASYSDHEAAMRSLASEKHPEGIAYFNRALHYFPTNASAMTASANYAFGISSQLWQLKTVVAFDSAVSCLRLHASGNLLAAGLYDGTVRHVHTFTGQEFHKTEDDAAARFLAFIKGSFLTASSVSPHGSGVNARVVPLVDELLDVIEHTIWPEFSQEGCRAEVLDDYVVRLYRASEVLFEHQFGKRVSCIAFSKSGAFFAAASLDGSLRVFDLTSKEEAAIYQFETGIWGLHFSPDDIHIAVGTGNVLVNKSGGLSHEAYACGDNFDSSGFATILNFKAKEVQYRLSFEAGVRAVKYSPDGRYLAAGATDTTFRIMDTSTGRELLMRHTSDEILSLSFSPDGRLLAVGSGDFLSGVRGAIDIVTVPEGKRVKQELLTNPVISVEFSDDGRYLAAAGGRTNGSKGEVRIFAASSSIDVSRSAFGPVAPGKVWFDEAGKVLIAMAREGAVIYSIDEADTIKSLFCPLESRGRFPSFAVSCNGTYCVVSGQGNLCFGYGTGACEIIEASLGSRVDAMEFSVDGTHLAVARRDGESASVRIYDVARKIQIRDVPMPKGNVENLTSLDVDAISPDLRFAVASSSAGRVMVFDLNEGCEIFNVCLKSFVTSVAFSSDSHFLAVSSYDQSLCVIDLTGRNVVFQNTVGITSVMGSDFSSVALSCDGKYVALGSHQKSLHIFETKTGRETCTLSFSSLIWSLSFSECGLSLAAIHETGVVMLDTATGKLIGNLPVGYSCGTVRFATGSSNLAIGERMLRVIDGHWLRGIEKAESFWHTALDFVSGWTFRPAGHLEQLTPDELQKSFQSLRRLVSSPADVSCKWQQAIVRWLMMPIDRRTTSPWTKETVREATGRWLIDAGRELSTIIQCADIAPWHPLEPVSLARLEPKPDENADVVAREAMVIRPRFLARLALKRLRDANEKLYGRDTLAEYAAWSAKIMHEELHLDPEALEAVAFALERMPKDKQQPLLELRSRIGQLK